MKKIAKIYLTLSIALISITCLSIYSSVVNQGNSGLRGSELFPRRQSIGSDGITYTIDCPIPPIKEVIPRLVAHETPITQKEALELSSTLCGITTVTNVQSMIDKELLIEGNGKAMHFREYTNFMCTLHSPFSEMTAYSNESLRKVADGFLNKVSNLIPMSNVSIIYDGIGIGTITIQDNITTINTMSVRYRVEYEGIQIRGAVITIDICNDEVVEFTVIVPYVTVEGKHRITITPEEALNKLLRGETYNEVTSTNLEGTERIIKYIRLCYFFTPGTLDGMQELLPVYVIGGDSITRNDAGNIRDIRPFHEYILAIR